MRQLMHAVALSSFIVVAGCTTSQVQQLDAITTSFIESVQDLTAASCGIIPEASAIATIFNTTVGATIASIGTAICKAAPLPASAAFKALPLRAGNMAPAVIGTINGVTVTGWRATAVKFKHLR